MRGHPSFKENAAGVRAMYLDMASRAGLVLICLIMERRRTRSSEIRRSRVALQAERIHVVACQQAKVRGTMREVAGSAAFCLERRMFIHKRARSFGVALRAYRILIRGSLEEFVVEGAMWIVAVAATQKAFVYLVMGRLRECGLGIRVATITKIRLRQFEHMPFALGIMCAVATGAAHSGSAMRRALKIGVIVRVTTEAGCINLFRCSFRELKDLGCVAAGFHMRFAWAMTALAGCALAPVHQRKFGVWIGSKFLGHFCVACFACLRADKVCRINLRRGC